MNEFAASVKLQVRNRNSFEELKQAISSIKGFQIYNSSSANYSCDLLIMEIGEDTKAEFQFIKELQKNGTAGEIFLTSSRTEPEILLSALRTGAKEFFPQPLNREEIRASLLKFRERQMEALSKDTGKIINVIGAKGGVGTTTVAVNLAASFKNVNGKGSVALMDLNLLFGEVPLFLDVKSTFNWGEMTKDISRLDSTYILSTLSKHPSGIYVLPAPARLEGMQAATPENVEVLVKQMQSTFDYIIVDSGHVFNNISLKMLEMSDIVLMVSVLSLPCLINISKLFDFFQKVGYPDPDKVKLVMNRNEKRGTISVAEAEKSTGKNVFWSIPNDYHSTMNAINQGKTLHSYAFKNPVTENFKEFAHALVAGKNGKGLEKGLLGNLFGRKSKVLN